MADARVVCRCVRCGRARRDTRLAAYWTCAPCVDELLVAFSQEVPVWEGNEVQGYCSVCNDRNVVRLRQWLVCLVCERVTRRIDSGRVAVRFVARGGATRFAPQSPNSTYKKQTREFRPYQERNAGTRQLMQTLSVWTRRRTENCSLSN